VGWFLELPVVRQHKTIHNIDRACRDLDKVFGPMLVKDFKPAMVEKYQHPRLLEPTRQGNPRSTANVNRNITVLKRMFIVAVREELAGKNPCWKIKMLPANHTRDRILSVEELGMVLGYLPPHAGRVVYLAYLTGMRAGEILNLTWDKMVLAQELVRLGAEDTKTSEPRIIFLCDRAYDILKVIGNVRSRAHNRVFAYRGKPIKQVKKAFTHACRTGGINNFWFHDRRHACNINVMKEGLTTT
jgi:integrase